MKRSRPSRDRGFTLIEVLLVLVILVVLASMAVMAYGPMRKQALINAAKTQVGMFKELVDAYETNEVGSPPSTASGLQALRTKPGDLPDPSKWHGPYIDKEIPLDPWGKAYQYSCPGAHNPEGFDVWTVAPDGQMIGNWSEERH
jgi:general secretion pathway protein G